MTPAIWAAIAFCVVYTVQSVFADIHSAITGLPFDEEGPVATGSVAAVVAYLTA